MLRWRSRPSLGLRRHWEGGRAGARGLASQPSDATCLAVPSQNPRLGPIRRLPTSLATSAGTFIAAIFRQFIPPSPCTPSLPIAPPLRPTNFEPCPQPLASDRPRDPARNPDRCASPARARLACSCRSLWAKRSRPLLCALLVQVAPRPAPALLPRRDARVCLGRTMPVAAAT